MIEDEKSFSSFYLYKKHQTLNCQNPKVMYIQYRDYRIDLLSGKRLVLTIEDFMQELDKYKVSTSFEKPIVIHLFYELGFFCTELEHKVPQNKPLAIVIEYREFSIDSIYPFATDQKQSVKFLGTPLFKEYTQKFEKIYRHLVDGDCYQVNLTMPFYFRLRIPLSPKKLVRLLFKDSLKIGAYAHATYIHPMDKLFLSNSPECLFQVVKNKKYYIRSLPIKGTSKVLDEKKRQKAWRNLQKSKKDQAELFMITDLIRNDLTKVTKKPSRVLFKKFPLHVPGLVHQFSVIESEIDENKSIRDVVMGLFPGGSITGAPKKRVMEIINDIEKYTRGFYCGSTLLLFKDLKAASINIRSAEIDFSDDEIKYGAGGGVTLMSQCHLEFDEMFAKFKSYLETLK